MFKTCSQCGFGFEDTIQDCPDFVPHSANQYADWCDLCFCELPLNSRFKRATPKDLEDMKERQEKTRESLKQRALDRKNKVGKTTTSKKGGDDLESSGGDALIFDEPTD